MFRNRPHTQTVLLAAFNELLIEEFKFLLPIEHEQIVSRLTGAAVDKCTSMGGGSNSSSFHLAFVSGGIITGGARQFLVSPEVASKDKRL